MRAPCASFSVLCCAALILHARSAAAADLVADVAAEAIEASPSLAAMRAAEDALRQSAAVAGTWLAPCLAQLVAFGLTVVREREGSSQGLETT